MSSGPPLTLTVRGDLRGGRPPSPKVTTIRWCLTRTERGFALLAAGGFAEGDTELLAAVTR